MIKSVFTSILLVVVVVSGFAGPTASIEIINDPSLRKTFYLSINGVKQNESPVENILIIDLPYEVYGVELEVVNDNKKVKKVVFLRIGQITRYVFTKQNEQFTLLESTGDIQAYNKQVLQLKYKNQELKNKDVLTDQESARFADYAAPTVNFDDVGESDHVPHTPAASEQLTLELNNQQQLRFDADSMFKKLKAEIALQDQLSNRPCEINLSNDDLKDLKSKIKDLYPLRERYLKALQILGNKCLTVSQLKDILKSLDGDELKIECYKSVYKQLSDFARRSDLFELFYFESSIDEIQNLR